MYVPQAPDCFAKVLLVELSIPLLKSEFFEFEPQVQHLAPQVRDVVPATLLPAPVSLLKIPAVYSGFEIHE
ncbi:hypothetical protein D3C80_1832770 [compost metagenome]